ncbi:hypothetical protein B5X24_HaOG211224 [Helicoverpa armigera]|uniref:Reverse transcriptase domain-containing protein n=1 Tax=Helicoverpa armigera TaxID=29058 RepID=A0A2W1BGT9_HELAM|nr:hypothetical protein B5X24_HaOG211224 [Helicoverpa armigera]
MVALQSDLARLDDSCLTNKLDLNPVKCSVVSFSRKRVPRPTTYKLKGQQLQRSHGVRDLGVFHDSKLLFNTHIEQIVAKASRSLGFIMRVAGCFKNAKTLNSPLLFFCKKSPRICVTNLEPSLWQIH